MVTTAILADGAPPTHPAACAWWSDDETAAKPRRAVLLPT